MKVYKVPNHAEVELIEKIVSLLMQQMTRHDTEEAYNLLLNGIKLALHEKSPAHIIVAEENDEILGVAFFNVGISLKMGGYYVWLNDLFVHSDYRNRGIAKKMLLHLIRWSEKENIRGIELETGINNSVTKHLYNSLGFYEIVSDRYCFNF
ncbi:GNAT family N-acetyltransferase [Pueribacillus sp. YX66]|uniref:GNAT family N-acetyltransferase n=1 Tax=Pueribacillus sp. YX66 TaxID=3229242 RepID=UPI00358D72AB